MRTVSDNLRDRSERLKEMLIELQPYSSIHRWNYNTGDLVWMGSDYSWTKLDESARPIQAKVIEDYRHFSSIMTILLNGQPTDTLDEFKDAEEKILNVVQQDGITWSQRADLAFSEAATALDQQVDLMCRLYDASEGKLSVVPDTNALLHNPALDEWRFDGVDRFVILLLPTVLAELDSLKVNHRVEEVRKKSEKIIRQIKEYRRRGRLTRGVPILKGVSELAAIATEPDVSGSLPWLDSTNNDDRLLAAVIEVMRLRPHSPVVLVTRDINLQNKAEFAAVPFVEPPDPFSPSG